MDSKKRTSRSARVNTARLIELRKNRGWTQLQLADLSGYSERVILKAEAGEPISFSTIAALAQTLSTPETPVAVADLLRSTIDVAREFIVLLYRHQAETVQYTQHLLDDDVEFHVHGEAAELPFAGRYRGHEAVARMFRTFFSVIETPADHDPLPHYQFFCQQDDVVAWGLAYHRPKGMPNAPPMPVTYLIRFRNDKIVYFEDRFDTTHGGQLLGTLPPPKPSPE